MAYHFYHEDFLYCSPRRTTFFFLSNWISVNLELALFDGIPHHHIFSHDYFVYFTWNGIFLYGFVFVARMFLSLENQKIQMRFDDKKGNHRNAHMYVLLTCFLGEKDLMRKKKKSILVNGRNENSFVSYVTLFTYPSHARIKPRKGKVSRQNKHIYI